EDVAGADLLLHVMDATAPDLDEQRHAVEGVLNEIGAADVPQLLVLNKADQLERDGVPRHPGLDASRTQLISALTGYGLDALRSAIAAALRGTVLEYEIRLPAGDGKNRAWLYAQGVVDAEATEPDGTLVVSARLDPEQHRALAERLGMEPGALCPAAGCVAPEGRLTRTGTAAAIEPRPVSADGSPTEHDSRTSGDFRQAIR
ncbi:MAG: hypothetical protein AAGG11_20965, partial [Pseudomonadota bacterium]